MVETLKYENKVIKVELENFKERVHEEKVKYLQENESLLKQIERLNEKSISLCSEKQELALKYQNVLEKNQSY